MSLFDLPGLSDIIDAVAPINTVANSIQDFSNGINSYVKTAVSTATGTIESLNNAVDGFVSTVDSISSLYNNVSQTFGQFSSGDVNLAKTDGNFWNNSMGSGSSVSAFLTYFPNGIARPNRFRVELTLPSGISDSSQNVNTESMSDNISSVDASLNQAGSINIKCHSVTLPQRTLQTFETKMNSASFRIPYACTYDPITIAFYADGSMDTREYFEIWQASVMNFGNNTMNFYNEYISDFLIYVQDQEGNDRYGIKIFEAYPIAVSAVDLNYGSDNAPLIVMVTLSYKSWLPMNNNVIPNRTIDNSVDTQGFSLPSFSDLNISSAPDPKTVVDNMDSLKNATVYDDPAGLFSV